MSETRILYSKEQIQKRVVELAKQLATEYNGKQLVLIGILKGSFIFLADLTRALYDNGRADVEIDFMTVSSYTHGTESNRQPTLIKDITIPIEGKNVVVVEDIVDTGFTMDFVRKTLSAKKPNSVKIMTFLNKPQRREIEVQVEYIGFTLTGSPWVEGYGLDGGEFGRGRSDIAEKITS